METFKGKKHLQRDFMIFFFLGRFWGCGKMGAKIFQGRKRKFSREGKKKRKKMLVFGGARKNSQVWSLWSLLVPSFNLPNLCINVRSYFIVIMACVWIIFSMIFSVSYMVLFGYMYELRFISIIWFLGIHSCVCYKPILWVIHLFLLSPLRKWWNLACQNFQWGAFGDKNQNFWWIALMMKNHNF